MADFTTIRTYPASANIITLNAKLSRNAKILTGLLIAFNITTFFLYILTVTKNKRKISLNESVGDVPDVI